MIAPILAIALASVVGIRQSETVDLAPMPVSDLVSSLSKSWGEELRVHPSLRREVVKLRCRNESREEILRVLSTVLSAEWSALGSGGRVLVRSEGIRRRLEQDELRHRKSLIESALRDQASPGKAGEVRERAELLVRSFRSWYQQRNLTLAHNYQSTPSQTNARLLLQRLVVTIGSDSLAGLPIGQSVVFGAPQTGKQRSFGKEQRRAIADFEEIEQYLADLVPPEWLTDLSARYWTENVFGPALRGSKVGPVAVHAVAADDSIGFVIAIYDETGSIRTGDHFNLSLGKLRTEEPSPPFEFPESNLVPVRPAAQTVVDALRLSALSQGGDSPVSAVDKLALREHLQKVDKEEPLSLFVEPAVCALAGSANIAARLEDGLFSATSASVRNGHINVREWYEAAVSIGTQFTFDKGWLLVTGLNPLREEATRVDRSVLARLLRQGISHGQLLLENYCRAYVDVSTYHGFGSFGNIYLRLLGCCDVYSNEQWDHSRYLSIILGCMSPTDWNMLRDSGSAPTSLESALREAENWSFSGPSELKFEREATQSGFQKNGSVHLKSGVTAPILVTWIPTTEVVAVKNGADGAPPILTAASMAYRAFQDYIEGSRADLETMLKGRYRYGEREKADVLIKLEGGARLISSVPLPHRIRSDVVEFSGLPASFRKSVADQFERLLKENNIGGASRDN